MTVTTYSDPVDAAIALYDSELRGKLEPQYNGKVVAIHPATGEFAVATNSSRARFALRSRHSEGAIVTLDIGPAESLNCSSRWLLASPATWRRAE